MKYIVRKYNAGETCKPDNPESVAKSIEKVWQNRSGYYQPQAIKDAIKHDLNFNEEGKKLLRIYEGLIK